MIEVEDLKSFNLKPSRHHFGFRNKMLIKMDGAQAHLDEKVEDLKLLASDAKFNIQYSISKYSGVDPGLGMRATVRGLFHRSETNWHDPDAHLVRKVDPATMSAEEFSLYSYREERNRKFRENAEALLAETLDKSAARAAALAASTATATTETARTRKPQFRSKMRSGAPIPAEEAAKNSATAKNSAGATCTRAESGRKVKETFSAARSAPVETSKIGASGPGTAGEHEDEEQASTDWSEYEANPWADEPNSVWRAVVMKNAQKSASDAQKVENESKCAPVGTAGESTSPTTTETSTFAEEVEGACESQEPNPQDGAADSQTAGSFRSEPAGEVATAELPEDGPAVAELAISGPVRQKRPVSAYSCAEQSSPKKMGKVDTNASSTAASGFKTAGFKFHAVNFAAPKLALKSSSRVAFKSSSNMAFKSGSKMGFQSGPKMAFQSGPKLCFESSSKAEKSSAANSTTPLSTNPFVAEESKFSFTGPTEVPHRKYGSLMAENSDSSDDNSDSDSSMTADNGSENKLLHKLRELDTEVKSRPDRQFNRLFALRFPEQTAYEDEVYKKLYEASQLLSRKRSNIIKEKEQEEPVSLLQLRQAGRPRRVTSNSNVSNHCTSKVGKNTKNRSVSHASVIDPKKVEDRKRSRNRRFEKQGKSGIEIMRANSTTTAAQAGAKTIVSAIKNFTFVAFPEVAKIEEITDSEDDAKAEDVKPEEAAEEMKVEEAAEAGLEEAVPVNQATDATVISAISIEKLEEPADLDKSTDKPEGIPAPDADKCPCKSESSAEKTDSDSHQIGGQATVATVSPSKDLEAQALGDAPKPVSSDKEHSVSASLSVCNDLQKTEMEDTSADVESNTLQSNEVGSHPIEDGSGSAENDLDSAETPATPQDDNDEPSRTITFKEKDQVRFFSAEKGEWADVVNGFMLWRKNPVGVPSPCQTEVKSVLKTTSSTILINELPPMDEYCSDDDTCHLEQNSPSNNCPEDSLDHDPMDCSDVSDDSIVSSDFDSIEKFRAKLAKINSKKSPTTDGISESGQEKLTVSNDCPTNTEAGNYSQQEVAATKISSVKTARKREAKKSLTKKSPSSPSSYKELVAKVEKIQRAKKTRAKMSSTKTSLGKMSEIQLSEAESPASSEAESPALPEAKSPALPEAESPALPDSSELSAPSPQDVLSPEPLAESSLLSFTESSAETPVKLAAEPSAEDLTDLDSSCQTFRLIDRDWKIIQIMSEYSEEEENYPGYENIRIYRDALVACADEIKLSRGLLPSRLSSPEEEVADVPEKKANETANGKPQVPEIQHAQENEPCKKDVPQLDLPEPLNQLLGFKSEQEHGGQLPCPPLEQTPAHEIRERPTSRSSNIRNNKLFEEAKNAMSAADVADPYSIDVPKPGTYLAPIDPSLCPPVAFLKNPPFSSRRGFLLSQKNFVIKERVRFEYELFKHRRSYMVHRCHPSEETAEYAQPVTRKDYADFEKSLKRKLQERRDAYEKTRQSMYSRHPTCGSYIDFVDEWEYGSTDPYGSPNVFPKDLYDVF
ncbi:hypothetical protein EJF18_10513 [Clavispora lusitaniae]|uniref:Uncharacterized protein n=1 Tax=Clavispora lusitaniae TaxID=36911 RepID=A0ACD0WDS0_CLALS|nr:hypothetical protein EJF14_10513 [Clavispora lusitaniae]QFZ31279.1 hypothetical protein EJF16_10513 [Clavispora lusitaniae]QFZ36947.1 hypothetical protein EJF15_10513 [Clavispora lusitaniae]QFZ42631.1 hypothetical protein EJF18_10513 [Clavispora lusitaniae]QFZ48307.1 hypothetical protein EJF17_10513 [Clavispora lusitaniae]